MARRKKSQTQQQAKEVSTDAEVTVEVVEEKASEPEVPSVPSAPEPTPEPAPVQEVKPKASKKAAAPKSAVEIVKGRRYKLSGEECVFVEAKGDKLVVRMTSDNTYRKVLSTDLT